MAKKIWRAACLALVVLLMVSSGVYSEVAPSAKIYGPTSRVRVSGALDKSKVGSDITLLLVKKDADLEDISSDDIGYIAQGKVEKGGKYDFRFPFYQNINNYQLLMNLDGENVTQSVTEAVATSEIWEAEVKFENTGYLSMSKVVMTIDNLYGIENMPYWLTLAFYSEEGRLISAVTTKKNAQRFGVTSDEVMETVPEDTREIKAFVWGNNQTQIPLAVSARKEYKNNFKILSIGNSFSRNAHKYIRNIAAADGIDVMVANMYIGGCTLQTHWANAQSNSKEYTYDINGGSNGPNMSISEALAAEDWDYITIQQASPKSGDLSSYYPYVENLARFINERKPAGAEIVIHQTWAYEPQHPDLPNLYGNQQNMYNLLKAAYEDAAVKAAKAIDEDMPPLRIIPSGTAFQNARSNPQFTGNLCHTDYYHASDTGMYLLGAVWYETLIGKEIKYNNFSLSGMSQQQRDILRDAAHRAVVEYGWMPE